MTSSHVVTSMKGLSAIVTGGSGGLGYATVERLTKAGCTVAILDIVEPKKLPQNSYFVKADITIEEEVIKALDFVEKKVKKLDILVNCAGYVFTSPVYNAETNSPHPQNEFDKVLKINTSGTFNMIRLSCSLFNKNQPNEDKQKGVIINTSSVAGMEAPGAFIAFAASESALIGMTLPLSRDLAQIGVRVVTIIPGTFTTPFITFIPPAVLDSIAASTPLPQRLGHPDEFAHFVQMIIENPMINGAALRLDGGFRAGAIL